MSKSSTKQLLLPPLPSPVLRGTLGSVPMENALGVSKGVDPREERQSPEPSPQGYSHAGTPIPAAAGQSKSPNKGSTRTLSPAAPTALQAHGTSGPGDKGLFVSQPHLQARHLPESGPTHLLPQKLPAAAPATAVARSSLPGPTWGRGGSPGSSSPLAARPDRRAGHAPCGLSARGLVSSGRGSADAPRGLANRVCGRAAGSAPRPPRGPQLWWLKAHPSPRRGAGAVRAGCSPQLQPRGSLYRPPLPSLAHTWLWLIVERIIGVKDIRTTP